MRLEFDSDDVPLVIKYMPNLIQLHLAFHCVLPLIVIDFMTHRWFMLNEKKNTRNSPRTFDNHVMS